MNTPMEAFSSPGCEVEVATPATVVDPPPPHIGRDILLVTLTGVLTFAFAATVELNEWLLSHTRPMEAYQLDELPVTVLVVVMAMIWLSWRRWRLLSREYRMRLQAQQALSEKMLENRRLAQKHMLAQEEERRYLAHEIHDELGQSLNAIKLDAVAIRQRRWAGQEELDRCADSIIEVTNQLHESIRALSRRLRPVALDELGLSDALELYISNWERRNAPVKCDFRAEGVLSELGELTNITLYRCVQESLTNITRHAAASQVQILLNRSGDRVQLSVQDNGRGMITQEKHAGLGLVGLRERAEALSGSFEVESHQGAGTSVRLTVPFTPVSRQ